MRLGIGRLARGAVGLMRYGGLIGVHCSAQVSVKGEFLFGRRVSIGRNSLVQIPRNAKLKLGNGVHIGREVELSPAGEITIGDFTSIQDRCIILGHVVIGANCLFAPNIMMSSRTHEFMEKPNWLIRDQEELLNDSEYLPSSPRHLPIEVGEDCWIGINSVVMRGVTIGRGCIIGANSVVTRSTTPYSILAGAPAKTVGQRLNFKPPREISAGDASDLPYFYSGFDLRQSETANLPGRWKTYGQFQIAIDCGASKALRIDLETDRPTIIKCATQQQSIGSGIHSVTFNLEPIFGRWLISLETRNAEGEFQPVSVWRVKTEE